MKTNIANVNDLITSSNGIHISIYLPRPSSTISCKNVLDLALARCESQMKWTVPPETMNRLLAPIKSLAINPSLMSEFTHSIGIFRSENFLRLISIPTKIDFSAHVADTFHVKPIFAHIQKDFRYIFFGTNGKKGYLYQGTKNTYNLVDEFHFLDDTFFKNDSNYMSLNSVAKKRNYLTKSNLQWVEQAISIIDKNKDFTIFISANSKESRILRKLLKGRNIYERNVSRRFSIVDEKNVHSTIQVTLDTEKNISEYMSLSEFKSPAIRRLSNTRVSFDLEEISLAALNGSVKKLLIASDANIFGKWDQKTGKILIHEMDTDHTDDDLLDDIAQKVFIAGGEILIFSKAQMPEGELIAAIIRDSDFSHRERNECSALESA